MNVTRLPCVIVTVFGDTRRLPEIIERLDIERVIVAFSSEPDRGTLERIRRLSAQNVQIDLVPRLFDVVGPRVVVHSVEGLPFVSLPPVRLTPLSRYCYRCSMILGRISIGQTS